MVSHEGKPKGGVKKGEMKKGFDAILEAQYNDKGLGRITANDKASKSKAITQKAQLINKIKKDIKKNGAETSKARKEALKISQSLSSPSPVKKGKNGKKGKKAKK